MAQAHIGLSGAGPSPSYLESCKPEPSQRLIYNLEREFSYMILCVNWLFLTLTAKASLFESFALQFPIIIFRLGHSLGSLQLSPSLVHLLNGPK